MSLKQEHDLNFGFYDDPMVFYNKMLADINTAKNYVFLQTYKFTNDPIGIKFKDILTRKAKEGLKILVLIDSWGAGVSYKFFSSLMAYGGQVKFFKKIRIRLDIFSANHNRNHRKLLIIDDKISYIGSANITAYSINWRESVLRIEGGIAKAFKKIFIEDYELSKKYFPNKIKYSKPVKYKGFEIIKEVPGTILQATRDKFLSYIKNAQKEIIIETPYFLPGNTLRKALVKAAERGVDVKVITPLHSDVGLFDILRNKYLGLLYKKNIEILQYLPHNLHAKILLIDQNLFCLGSSNFDYRSFRFQHEINFTGKDKHIVKMILSHIEETKTACQSFDYKQWKNRSRILKIAEMILIPIRHLF